MRILKEKEKTGLELSCVICNQCGKELLLEDGIMKEGCFHAEHAFEYFSNKDGYVYHIDLCEECFDKWTKGFSLPPEITETKEFI